MILRHDVSLPKISFSEIFRKPIPYLINFQSLSLLLYAVSKAPEFKVIGKIDEDVMFFPDKLIPLLDGKVIDPDAAAFYGQLLKEGEPVIKKKDAHW